jgi:mono/diheme cytochrome c family protein
MIQIGGYNPLGIFQIMKCICVLLFTSVLAIAMPQSVVAEDTPDLESQITSLQQRLNAIQLGYSRIAETLDSQEDQNDFFLQAVLPIFESRCFECHTETKQKGELRLDTLEFMLEGGETQPAVVPGSPDESLFIRAIRHTEELKMPEKQKLPQGEIDILAAWVAIGAPWPEDGDPSAKPQPTALRAPAVKAREVPKVTFALGKGAPISFDRDIRPILSDNCSACHGPDQNKRKAKLHFDVETAAFSELPSGRRAIVPGDLENSQIFQRIAAHNPDDVMPPSDFRKSLSKKQIELIGRWILQGAKWESHWAFVPPERPATPAVQAAGRIENDIDRFA